MPVLDLFSVDVEVFQVYVGLVLLFVGDLLRIEDEEAVVAEEDDSILEEDSTALDGVVDSLEVASAELSIEGSMSSTLLEDSRGGFTTLGVSLSPHAEIKIPDTNTMQE